MSNPTARNAAPRTGIDEVTAITARVLRIDPDIVQICEESNLHDMGLDSISVVELITEFESACNITIDVEDLSEDLFNRFGNLVEFIQMKVGREENARQQPAAQQRER